MRKQIIIVAIILLGSIGLVYLRKPYSSISFNEFLAPEHLLENVLNCGLFDKKEWDIGSDDLYFHRGKEFKHFLFSYAWRHVNRKDVKTLLGAANHRYIDSDIYVLNSGSCGHAFKGVEIFYDDDVMSKYRYLNLETYSGWIPAWGITIQ